MTRARLNIFVEPEHARRLEDISAHRGVSKSSVIAAALSSFLSPDATDQREAATAKRLDRLSRQFERLERDQAILIETVALYLRHYLTVALPVSEQQQEALRAQVRAVGEAATPYQPSDAQIAFHLARFVTDVRSLSIDPIVVRQNWLEAYDYTTDKGAATLNDYARVADPFSRIGQHSVTVAINSVVRASDASFQVRWTERRYVNGEAAGLERWTAVLSIVLQAPRSEERLRKNPLGIYVNGLSWSRELDASEGVKKP